MDCSFSRSVAFDPTQTNTCQTQQYNRRQHANMVNQSWKAQIITPLGALSSKSFYSDSGNTPCQVDTILATESVCSAHTSSPVSKIMTSSSTKSSCTNSGTGVTTTAPVTSDTCISSGSGAAPSADNTTQVAATR